MSSDDRRIEFRRVHHAPIDLVFDCLTTPSHLANFWGPDGCTTPQDSIVVDLRPGGVFHLDMVFGDGAYVAPMRARYDVIERPHRLSWTETDNGMRSEVELNDLGDGTTEVITILIDPPEGFADTEGRRGFETSLDRMVTYTQQARHNRTARVHFRDRGLGALPRSHPTTCRDRRNSAAHQGVEAADCAVGSKASDLHDLERVVERIRADQEWCRGLRSPGDMA